VISSLSEYKTTLVLFLYSYSELRDDHRQSDRTNWYCPWVRESNRPHPPPPFITVLLFTQTAVVPRRVEGWVDLDGWLPIEVVYPSPSVTHPSINHVRRRATTLTEINQSLLSSDASRQRDREIQGSSLGYIEPKTKS